MLYRGTQRYDYSVTVEPREDGKYYPAITFYWTNMSSKLWKSDVLITIGKSMHDVPMRYRNVVERLWFEEHTNGLSMKGGEVGTLKIKRTPVDARRSF